jgi:hypothetical protein
MPGDDKPPVGDPPNDMPWAPVVRGAWDNLQLWVRQGVAPPQARPIEVDASGKVVRDAYGNAQGGLRLPYIEAPTSTHTGFLSAGGVGGTRGTHRPFTPALLKTLYADRSAYLARFSAATARLVAGRWISSEDAAAMKAAAAAADR